MPSNDAFVALTSDVVRSRDVPDRETLQRRIEEALAEANRRFAGELVVPLAVTLGDEWQGLPSSLEVSYEVDLFLRFRLAPATLCSGVGRGPISTSVKPRTADMDGVCFHRSREALERAKRRRAPGACQVTGDSAADRPANAISLLLAALADAWTERQLRTVAAVRGLGTERAAAEALGVSQVTIHKSLAAARGREFLEALDELKAFLREHSFTERGGSE